MLFSVFLLGFKNTIASNTYFTVAENWSVWFLFFLVVIDFSLELELIHMPHFLWRKCILWSLKLLEFTHMPYWSEFSCQLVWYSNSRSNSRSHSLWIQTKMLYSNLLLKILRKHVYIQDYIFLVLCDHYVKWGYLKKKGTLRSRCTRLPKMWKENYFAVWVSVN